jgi:hypothetical protein
VQRKVESQTLSRPTSRLESSMWCLSPDANEDGFYPV